MIILWTLLVVAGGCWLAAALTVDDTIRYDRRTAHDAHVHAWVNSLSDEGLPTRIDGWDIDDL